MQHCENRIGVLAIHYPCVVETMRGAMQQDLGWTLDLIRLVFFIWMRNNDHAGHGPCNIWCIAANCNWPPIPGGHYLGKTVFKSLYLCASSWQCLEASIYRVGQLFGQKAETPAWTYLLVPDKTLRNFPLWLCVEPHPSALKIELAETTSFGQRLAVLKWARRKYV